MGIRFSCPNGHHLHVKTFLAGKRGVCPQCGAKILIPSQEPSQPQATPEPARASQGSPTETAASTSTAGTLPEAGSASTIIATTNSSVANSPITDKPVSVPPQNNSAQAAIHDAPTAIPAPQEVVAQPAESAQQFIMTDAIEPASPAVRYVAQRERNRRNQMVFAVMLLLAVIVLAGVLIFVLQRGVGQSSAQHAASRDVAVSAISTLTRTAQWLRA